LVYVNGNPYEVAGCCIGDVIREFGYDISVIAVELNEEIVPKTKYDLTKINDGDVIEVVSFVGGG